MRSQNFFAEKKILFGVKFQTSWSWQVVHENDALDVTIQKKGGKVTKGHRTQIKGQISICGPFLDLQEFLKIEG